MLADLAAQLMESTGIPEWILLIALKVGVISTTFLPGICVLAMMFIWGERKIAGHMQSRLGPTHVGPFGLFQSLADGIKLVLKEDLVPGGADQVLFRTAPYVAFTPVFIAFLVIPFGPQFVFEANLNIGVLYLLAVLGVEVIAIIMAGWASNSKWAIYGAMREACQMVSYEIPLGIAILCGVLIAGTLNLVQLNFLQGGGIHQWFLFHNPFIFLAFFVYFVASLASAKRAPFDLPDAESELVAGFHTEYSGLRWAMFFFAEYAGMFVIGCIMTALFLGGWGSPFGVYDPIYQMIGYNPINVGSDVLTGSVALGSDWPTMAESMGLSGGAKSIFILNAYSASIFIAKSLAIVFIHIWLRWTLPRIRIDQVMHGCVKGLLPVSLALFIGVALWLKLLPATSVDAFAHGTTNVAHLQGDISSFQLGTQIICAAVGVAIFGFYIGVMVFSFFVRHKHATRKGLFESVMPVGKKIAFTRGPDYLPESERSLAKK